MTLTCDSLTLDICSLYAVSRSNSAKCEQNRAISGVDITILLFDLMTLNIYTVFQKSDAKIQITITTAYLIKIKYPLIGFNYRLSDVNVANFNKIHRTVSKQQLF